jgi:NADPH2:quinone reductase
MSRIRHLGTKRFWSVESAAVNFMDVMLRRGDDVPRPAPMPCTPGCEVAGTIAAVGDGVTNLDIGARVVAMVSRQSEGG